MADRKNNKKKIKFPGRGALPGKREINLASVGIQKINKAVLIPSVLGILLAAGLFSKFAVADRLAALNRAQGEAAALQAELDSGYAKIGDLGNVEDAYAHYTDEGLTAEEKNQADRMEAIELINDIVLPQANVLNWTIQENEIDLPVTGTDLRHLSAIAEDLEADERVEYCVITAASTNDTNNTKITGQLTVYLVGAAEEKTEGDEEE